jgi:prepilin-type N-terminal cleavage/methylation domain-containing protein
MNRRRGFTLLELLLATTLAAALMVLVLTVTASIRRSQSALRNDRADRQAMTRLEELMEQDASMSSKIQMRDDEVWFDGYSRLDRATQGPSHGATRVIYRLVRSNGHGYLLRQQTDLDNQTNQESQVELIMADVSRFVVESNRPGGANGADMPASTQPSRRRPSYLMISVASEDSTTPAIEKKLLLVD